MVVIQNRQWAVAPAAPPEFVASLPEVHPIVAQVLYNRGFGSAAAARAFLASSGAALHDPRSLYGMDRAIDRLRRALRDGEIIAVHGDFDVDGVTAAAILYEGLRAAGGRVLPPHIPQRTTTGYGVHASAIEKLAADGARVMVTGDTGTRALEAVERANQLGVDVVITDHHLPGEALPAACAVINPQQSVCPYPFKQLSGAGVAWKLVQALALEGLFDLARAEDLIDLVALGTIVDVSPLLGENRTLVQWGLDRLLQAPRPGIRALMNRSSATQRRPALDERTVAFIIGPRLNAAGRMDDATLALELLLTEDERRAAELVLTLEQKNLERQQLTERVLVAARAQAERVADQPVLVLRGEDWPSGVIGLVAARLAEEFGRPAVLVEVRPDACRGSGRGAQGFDLVGLLTSCADLLIEFGGHAQAAGFAVHPDRLDALVDRLVAGAAKQGAGEAAPLTADCALSALDVEWPLHQALRPLRPFGAGNPQPSFMTAGVPVMGARAVGTGAKHLQLRLRFGRQVLHAFGPELGPRAATLARAGRVDAIYSLDVSTWNGRESLELRLHDVRPASTT
ncbi:MAG: single-stranded-DNA-specific exonuclease RecJ [Chloroflexi bacterium]|nr:single-stranded-DNA-specific exonuclease RecJ [Chloroflexota bacterium]